MRWRGESHDRVTLGVHFQIAFERMGAISSMVLEDISLQFLFRPRLLFSATTASVADALPTVDRRGRAVGR